MNFLSDLNPPQKEAVEYNDGPLLVLAGAGSGKTRVLTYKIAYLIGVLKVKPWEILAVTFTNKAAEEMKERVQNLIGPVVRKVWLGTFHGFCARVLRIYADTMGYTKDYTIYDADDSKTLIKKIIKEQNITCKLSPKTISNRISRAKNKLMSADEYPIRNFYDTTVAHIYTLYQTMLQKNNIMDFDDLLINACKLFNKSNDAIEKFSFKYILVDEYQDTNYVQYTLLKLLSRKYNKLTVVGDEDQSIYGFRGAEVRNIIDFQKDWPEAKIIKLEQNYRSTQTILDAASSVASHNFARLGKNLWTENKGGENIRLCTAMDEEDEASVIAKIIKNDGKKEGNFLVLYRTNAQSRVIEEAMIRENLPYVIVGGVRFYERKEIKDLLVYLRLLSNPSDLISFRRAINSPPRGIGEATIARIEKFAEKEGIPTYFALEKIDNIDEIPASRKESLNDFFRLMEQIKKRYKKPGEILKHIIEQINYFDFLEQEGEIEATSRKENIKELISASSNYESLERFLETVSLLTDIDQWDKKDGRVTLMTAHNAKGLEFPIVFIAGLEEELFPHKLSLNTIDEVEEERRLFYVGLTRAKEKVYLSYAISRSGRNFCRPSRFLSEISDKCLARDRI